MTNKPRDRITRGVIALAESSIEEAATKRFRDDFERAFGQVPSIVAQLRTPEGEPLRRDDESITALLKRTGGQ